MNFSGISEKTLLGKLVRLPLGFIPAQMRMPVLQGKLKGRKWIVGSGNHGYWLGSYEYEKRLVFERAIAEKKIVFDIGAHVGFYTLLASVLVGPDGRVFAFEPMPRNLFYLKEHLRLNHVTNVTLIEAAVLDYCGETLFDLGPNGFMGHVASEGQLQVKVVRLDELVSRGEIPPPDYVKIDVEGAEMLVLLGAQSMLADSHPTLFLATHDSDIHQRCCQFLESLGYQLQAIDGKTIEQSDEILAFRKE